MSLKSLSLLLSGASMSVLLAATPSLAGTVTLTSPNSDTSLRGELVGVEDNKYVIETSIGTMRVAMDMVNCEGDSCPVIEIDNEINLVGSPTLSDRLMPALLAGYSVAIGGSADMTEGDDKKRVYKLNSESIGEGALTLTSSGATSAFQALVNREVGLALTTRPASEEEAKAAKATGIPALRGIGHEHVIGYDGLLLVTNNTNGIRAMSEATAAQIFSGKIRNWSELGGQDAPINVYVREEGSGARSLFDEMLMRSNRERVSPDAKQLMTDADVANAVASDPNGFGFTSMVYAGDAVKPLAIEGVCGLRTPPTSFTIKTGEYPLTRPLYLYSASGKTNGHTEKFVDYVTSEEGQKMVTAAGFVGQAISSEALNAQGTRVASTLLLHDEKDSDIGTIRNMLSMLMASDRLSTTVRFTQGNSQLDSSAQADVERLGEMLTAAEYADKEFYFMGFSDSVGRADLNQLLALQRAELVRKALLEKHPELASRIKARSVGFGEISPLGCNETRAGRSINRRVEVWMQDIASKKS